MIQRRREKRVLDALGDLSIYLQGLREERKAVIAVSDGWLLYRPNQALERIGLCGQPPTGPQVGVGPTGRLTTDLPRDQGNYSQQTCSIDRQHLANLDDWQTFRDLLDRANRANVSFYPIDSRGLPAFDTGIDEDTATTIGVPVQVDHALLTARIENLRTLADATDGLAVVENNNIELGVRRIVDDLTSYYLLGYYSTNAKLDGRFRSIKVRVKRPGVDVRARRGYKAATEEELTRGRELSAKAEVTGPPPAFQSAMAALASVRPRLPLRDQRELVGRTPRRLGARGQEPPLGRWRDGPGHGEIARVGFRRRGRSPADRGGRRQDCRAHAPGTGTGARDQHHGP